MKKAILACLLASAFFAGGAEAQKNPPYDLWCRDAQLGRAGGSVMVCRAYTYEQCMASRNSHIETCYLNPLYDKRNAGWRKSHPNY